MSYCKPSCLAETTNIMNTIFAPDIYEAYVMSKTKTICLHIELCEFVTENVKFYHFFPKKITYADNHFQIEYYVNITPLEGVIFTLSY